MGFRDWKREIVALIFVPSHSEFSNSMKLNIPYIYIKGTRHVNSSVEFSAKRPSNYSLSLSLFLQSTPKFGEFDIANRLHDSISLLENLQPLSKLRIRSIVWKIIGQFALRNCARNTDRDNDSVRREFMRRKRNGRVKASFSRSFKSSLEF